MTSIAVVAHRRKSLDGGLPELRSVLASEGVTEPVWSEVDKSSRAPACVRAAVKAGADVVFVWGGDGMVQRCADELAGTGVALAVVPAGTANLLASNLGVPIDLRKAVEVGLRGYRRQLDLGVINGERFAVMAGAGFDSTIMADVDRGTKERFGRLAYIRSAVDAVNEKRQPMTIEVDGRRWFKGKASCVLFGNVSAVTGGLNVFPDARPDDGMLEIGVVTARSFRDWARVLARVAARHPDRSPMVSMTRGHKATVKLDEPARYELDGGARRKVGRLKVKVDPRALWVCVPEPVTA